MNICISAIIKDEQLYLENWIKYHLNYGISKFILFEDKNSISHQEICDKFGDKVKLIKLWDVVTDYELTTQEGISDITWRCFYRLYKDKFDACLFIDPDEFLNCSPEEFSSEIEYFKNDNDVWSIKYIWLTRTADGHIKNPYNGKPYSLFNTYKKQLNGYNMFSKFNSKYNYHDYNMQGKHFIYLYKIDSVDNFIGPHGTGCNEQISNFRLNHYLTKSWEEYKFRLFKRGEPIKKWGRRIEDFFEINEDLLPYKEQLLKECENETYYYNEEH